MFTNITVIGTIHKGPPQGGGKGGRPQCGQNRTWGGGSQLYRHPQPNNASRPVDQYTTTQNFTEMALLNFVHYFCFLVLPTVYALILVIIVINTGLKNWPSY